jgi:hypothetical protein
MKSSNFRITNTNYHKIFIDVATIYLT